MKFYSPAPTTISQLNATGWDADLVVPAARMITVDHIAETTAAHNIIHDDPGVGIMRGNGNSATGAVLAHSEASPTIGVGQFFISTRAKRAGVFAVRIRNEIAFAGGGYVTFWINAGTADSSTVNNAAGTDEAIGDQTFAVGDLIRCRCDVAMPALQNCMISFYNADGMWY